MSLINRLSAAWAAFVGPPPVRDVWQTESEMFLRTEQLLDESWGWLDPVSEYRVYALRQKSLTSDKTRVIEDWRRTL